MVNTMARRTDGGVRFRPVGSQRSRTAPVYSPRGTGCPAIEQAVQGLYKGQNEESFWSLMSALNYALELETHVLVPLQTALSAQGAPAPWMEHPIPAEKADGLALWTLRNDKGRCWLPLFTSVAAAGADRSTGSRPMADRTLEQAMQLALDTPGIDGVVLDPWSNSASLDGALLNGLLHAGHTPEGPGAEEAEAGKEAWEAPVFPPEFDTGRQRQSATRKPLSREILPGSRCWASACIRGAACQKALRRHASCGKLLPKAVKPSPF